MSIIDKIHKKIMIKFKKGNLFFDNFFKRFFIVVDICDKKHKLSYRHCKKCNKNYALPNAKCYLSYYFNKNDSYFRCNTELYLLKTFKKNKLKNENNSHR